MVNPIATLLRESGAIEVGDFLLASGARSSYYIDIKAATTNPTVLAAIGKTIAEGWDFEVVAGVAVGAVPIAVAVSLASGRPYAIIRREEKDHGKAGTIIGDVSGRDVLLVEDVTTSGGSASMALRRCVQRARMSTRWWPSLTGKRAQVRHWQKKTHRSLHLCGLANCEADKHFLRAGK